MALLCLLCSLPKSESKKNKSNGKSSMEIRGLVNKIFGIDLLFGSLYNQEDVICVNCDINLEIAHEMYEMVIKAQNKLKMQKKLVEVRSDTGEILSEQIIYDESLVKCEIKEEVFIVEPDPIKPLTPVQKTSEDEEDEQIAQFFSITCSECPNKPFSTFTMYKTHLRQEHAKSSAFVACNHCNIKLDKRNKLLEHILYHQNPDMFKCPECGKQFSSKEKVQNHQKTIHGPMEDLKHECEVCGKRFLKTCTLTTHKVIHLSKEERDALNCYRCNECRYACDSKYKIQKHIEQVHLNKNLYVCDICAKVYKTKSQYQYHYTRAHQTTPQPKVQCHICQRYLLNEICLQKHIHSIHTKAGNYACDICGKVSHTLKSLRSHQRYVHKYTRKFECKICCKKFKVADALKEHLTTHVGGALYNCTFCERTFNSKANMYSHRKKMHPVELEKLQEEKRARDTLKNF